MSWYLWLIIALILGALVWGIIKIITNNDSLEQTK